MTTLTYPSSNFDATANFKVAGLRGACYLFCAAIHPDFKDGLQDEEFDAIFVMQHSGVIQSHYSAADIEAIERFKILTPLESGEEVEVDGRKYTLRILGNYSDAGYLIPVA